MYTPALWQNDAIQSVPACLGSKRSGHSAFEDPNMEEYPVNMLCNHFLQHISSVLHAMNTNIYQNIQRNKRQLIVLLIKIANLSNRSSNRSAKSLQIRHMENQEHLHFYRLIP